MLRQAFVIVEHLVGNALQAMQRQQGQMCLSTERVEIQYPSQITPRFLDLAARFSTFGQSEISCRIICMPLRKGVQEAFPCRFVLRLPKGGLHIPKGQKEKFRPSFL
jgi:hypothetical protein